MADGFNFQPRVKEPESAMIPGMAAPQPRVASDLPAAAPLALVMPTGMTPTPGPGPYALQEPAAWVYDFDPATGQSRASFNGVVLFAGASPGIVTTFNGRSGDIVLTGADLTATGGAVGVVDGSNAAAGRVGEFLSAQVLIGSALALVSAATTNITSLALSAGDWEVSGNICFNINPAVTSVYLVATLNTVSATLPTRPNGGAFSEITTANASGNLIGSLPVSPLRVSLAAPATVYLISYATFIGGTVAAYGYLSARRVR